MAMSTAHCLGSTLAETLLGIGTDLMQTDWQVAALDPSSTLAETLLGIETGIHTQ